jgi:hypothetical protein
MRAGAKALTVTRVGLIAGLVLLAPLASRGYEREEAASPSDGQSVSARVRFFIAAEGDPDLSERYRIEVGNEDFDTVLYTFDQSKDPQGWSVGVIAGLEGISEEEAASWRGIFFTPRKPLADGQYLWRALKHDGVSFEELGGELAFRVDTVAPGPVSELAARRKEDGTVELTWRPVFEDAEGQPEIMAGYRIYRYTTRHYLRVRDTILVGEVIDARFTDLYADEDTDVLSYYQVNGVDEAGNEAGRQFPLKLGETP